MEFAHMAIVPYDPGQSAFPFDGGDAVMRRVARQIAFVIAIARYVLASASRTSS